MCLVVFPIAVVEVGGLDVGHFPERKRHVDVHLGCTETILAAENLLIIPLYLEKISLPRENSWRRETCSFFGLLLNF